MMRCPDCGADLGEVPVDQPCPNCGSERRDATVYAPTVEAKVSIPTPTIRITPEILWDTASLTFAAVVYTVVITVVGVLVATFGWPWRLSYAVSSLALLFVGLTVPRLRRGMIRVSKKLVGRLSDLPPPIA